MTPGDRSSGPEGRMAARADHDDAADAALAEDHDDALADAALAGALAAEAGHLLLGIRSSGFAEAIPASELGKRGDQRSNQFILGQLRAERPSDALLSEEAADNSERLHAERVWIIDPLDGTREFTMEGRSDWAVHVALWQWGRTPGQGITAAAVALPALGEVWSTAEPSTPPPATRSRPLILVSDSRPPAFAAELAGRIGADVAPMGSAGAKAMAVVRGDADAYVHAGGQWEWDSAAPVGVAQTAGLHTSRLDGSPLRYNEPRPYLPDLLIARPELAETILRTLADVGL